MGRPAVLRGWLVMVLAAAVRATAASQQTSSPSRLSVDFSSSLMVLSSTPANVLANVDALYKDMMQDGVNTLCAGRYENHVCSGPTEATEVNLNLPFLRSIVLTLPKPSKLTKLLAPPAEAPTSCGKLCQNYTEKANPCSCAAPGNKTRCSCEGTLTGQQYFQAANYGVELARVLVRSVNESNTITGVINANFNSTVRLKSSKLVVARAEGAAGEEGGGDLELDESHLDLLQGSVLMLVDDGDLEVEDNGALWMAGSSKIVATGESNIQTQLAHILMEEGSSITVTKMSQWNMTQEFDMTPAMADAVCSRPFQPNPVAEKCFNQKEECRKRGNLLSVQEAQAIGMLKYPPALDQWGRQAFDYADDNTYDDYYDSEYEELSFEAGACLGSDVCGSDGSAAKGRRLAAAPAVPPSPGSQKAVSSPPPSAPAADTEDDSYDKSIKRIANTTEVNAKDTADGTGYDPAWGEGPFGETLCDAPPGKAFNYYGMIVRGGSKIVISSGSSWVMFDQSRLFVQDSTIILVENSTLHLMNSTLVLINSKLTVSNGAQILLEKSSSLQLYNSTVFGDSALYAVPANSTWQNQPWQGQGDYRSSPGGGLPVFMGVRPGVQVGTYDMDVSGFGLEAKLMPPTGCSCKKPPIPTFLTAVGDIVAA